MASQNISFQVTSAASSTTFDIESNNIVKVYTDNGTGAYIDYLVNKEYVTRYLVTETPAAVSSAAGNLIAVTLLSGAGTAYLNADRVKELATNGSGVDITYNSQGAFLEKIQATETRTAVRALINAVASGEINDITAVTADGPITIPNRNNTFVITKGSIAVLTIANPTATTQDGVELTIISTTAFAHTLSNAAGAGFNDGGAASDIATFGAAKGNNIVIVAYQGKWYVKTSVGITLA